MKTFLKTLILALAAGVLAALCFAGVGFVKYKKTENTVKQALIRQQEVFEQVTYDREKEITGKSDENSNDVSRAARCAMPSLVSVGVKSVSYRYDFFGREYPQEVAGNASGIIAAQNLGEILIVTNNHVVDGVTEVNVTFIDGTTAPAEIKATEEADDLAVIGVKLADISAETLSEIRIATFGDSELLYPGDMVIAVGNALGYGQSVTVGYVSALNREVKMDDHTLSLIQTDVAINPGNSGGALLNSRGEVVGINNAKIAAESVEGVCYAIPVSSAIPVIEVLMTRKVLPEEEQAILGFSGEVVSAEDASFYNIPRGIYVREVKSGSPAENAGMKKGDIIVAVNGKNVNSQEGYEKIMSYTPGGSEGTVTVKRLTEGEYVEKTLNVVFGCKK